MTNVKRISAVISFVLLLAIIVTSFTAFFCTFAYADEITYPYEGTTITVDDSYELVGSYTKDDVTDYKFGFNYQGNYWNLRFNYPNQQDGDIIIVTNSSITTGTATVVLKVGGSYLFKINPYNYDWDKKATIHIETSSSSGINSVNLFEFDVYRKKVVTEYTVTFDGNGGNIEGDSNQVITDGVSVSYPVVTRTGYNFACWSTSIDSVVAVPDTITENITIYAIWVPVEVVPDNPEPSDPVVDVGEDEPSSPAPKLFPKVDYDVEIVYVIAFGIVALLLIGSFIWSMKTYRLWQFILTIVLMVVWLILLITL